MEVIAILSDHEVPVIFGCRYFGVSTSRFYQWRKSKEMAQLTTKEQIKAEIKRLFDLSRGTYGSPRIYHSLVENGIQVSLNTVAKYMTEMGLDARLKKKFRIQTTDSDHDGPIADRLFKVEDHQTLPTGPGKLLAGDITYLRLGDSFVYLAVVLDVFTREIVGWSMDRSLKTELILRALSSAMYSTSPDAEVIFHSDRGSQYASEAYRKMMINNRVTPSMSRRGNCYDNSYVESWFASLKKERLYRSKYTTENELKALVFEYIEVWYNRSRKHSALDNLSPVQFKERHLAAH